MKITPNQIRKTILKFVITTVASISTICANPYQNGDTVELTQQLNQLIAPYKATVGIAVYDLKQNQVVSVYNEKHPFPMQSVYKFPLALAILAQVDKAKLRLDQEIYIAPTDLRPKTWSPLREKYPAGKIKMAISELLYYAVSLSDNNACDILFKLLGGPKKVERYIHSIGITQIAIATTEKEMAKGWDVQYRNWCTPIAMMGLLNDFHQGRVLSTPSRDFLMQLMRDSPTGAKRIKGLLPQEAVVAHKTGTSDTNAHGVRAAVNDAAIVTLPGGKSITIVVFVSDSYESLETSEAIIANISKVVYDYFAKENTSIKLESPSV